MNTVTHALPIAVSPVWGIAWLAIGMMAVLQDITLSQVIGACVAVIVAGMPAMIALIKIHSLIIHVNSRMDQLLAVASKLARQEGFQEGAKEERNIAEQAAKDLIHEEGK